ncbi:tRNA(Ile)-lysidine synthase [Kordia periserrulae]|uniref:tRNA(Ile)-lysidine synthase n=1 Tax=Kordia periserrulae TaxID=701523 RepID=A0A2T6C455_9FLAO|nr:tRNA lysidine(34) synthetase TilS [Kordia periserrulae]PTX63111.1 tRNA(Ile)-lysidine synthase [Kordia periserrulae]
MLEKLETHITANFSFLKNAKLLIAISGGLDSVVLSKLLHKLNYSLAFAHCNFQLRGKESDGDEIFVKELAETLNVKVFSKKFETEAFAKQEKLSIQMAARKLRYEWFQELARTFQYDYIVTAHHKDDALETFIINLSRGTGIEGLTGIPERNGNIVRPLLSFTREDIHAYAKEQQLQWREDSSNASTKYLRNKIRHDIVPLLQELHPTFMDNFEMTQQHLRGSNAIIHDRIQQLKERLLEKVAKDYYQIEIAAIEQLSNPKAYLYELLKEFGFHHWEDVSDMLSAQSGKQLFSAHYRLIKDRTHLLIQKQSKDDKEQEILIKEIPTELKTPIQLHIEEVARITDTGKNILYVAKELLKFPLIVRKWKNGDYFYPLGMRGKKKVSKYFKDEKYSLIDKEHQWLLCSGENIVWIIGKRSDNRYKLTQPTNTIIKLTLH